MMTPEMKQTFDREGFLAVEGVFTEDELIPIRAQIDALIDRPVHHVPLTGERNLPDSLAVPVPAGSVIFHHGCTLHHSDENRSDRWRKAIIFHFTTSDAMSEHDSFNEEVSLEID